MEKIKLKANRRIILGKVTPDETNISFEEGEVKTLPATEDVMSYADGSCFEILEVVGEKGQFKDKLKGIDGVGEKTAKDILDVASNESELRELVEEDKLPFQNDIEEKLKERFK